MVVRLISLPFSFFPMVEMDFFTLNIIIMTEGNPKVVKMFYIYSHLLNHFYIHSTALLCDETSMQTIVFSFL